MANKRFVWMVCVANFTMPEVGQLFDSVELTEEENLNKEEAEKLVTKYREEAQKQLPPQEKRFRDNRYGGTVVFLSCPVVNRGRTNAKKLRFLRQKRAGYANLKMPCVYRTQRTVTSHIKMLLVFSFFAPSREGL